MASEPSAAEITRRAKSNLAFALRCVPKERRGHLVSFYAFCRVIDDLADDLDVPTQERQIGLERWSTVLRENEVDPQLGLPDLQKEVLEVRDLYDLPKEYFINIIEGCQLDLHPQRFGTWEDLKKYTYRVASSVGLITLPIFGADRERCEEYAVTLGHALQLTNILRDIHEDLANGGRIYLPLHEMAQFQYTERDLIGRVYDGRFMAFMAFQADRAEALYQEAEALLPAPDFKALLAPRVMHRIYQNVLQKMRDDRYQVFQKRYRVSKGEKILHLLKGQFARQA